MTRAFRCVLVADGRWAAARLRSHCGGGVQARVRLWLRLFTHLCEGAYRESCRVSCLQRYREKAEPLAVETRQAGEVLHDQDALAQEQGVCRTFRILC